MKFHLPARNPDSGFEQYLVYNNNIVSYTSSGTKITYDDRTTQVRKRMVAGTPNKLYIDITKTQVGFIGIEDTDWEWINLKNLSSTGTSLANFRNGVSTGSFVVDAVINATGFTGVEDTDWENLSTHSGSGVETTFRDGVRSAAYVIDKELNATGFIGVENTDWENLVELKIP